MIKERLTHLCGSFGRAEEPQCIKCSEIPGTPAKRRIAGPTNTQKNDFVWEADAWLNRPQDQGGSGGGVRSWGAGAGGGEAARRGAVGGGVEAADEGQLDEGPGGGLPPAGAAGGGAVGAALGAEAAERGAVPDPDHTAGPAEDNGREPGGAHRVAQLVETDAAQLK